MADPVTDQSITYNAIPTMIGLTKIQLAMTTGVDLILSTMAFGDGGGTTPTPSPEQTSLVNQLGSVDILGHEDDLENNVTWYSSIIEAGIAEGTIREIGLFDDEGNLCFVGNVPDILIPTPMEGVSITIPVQLGIKNYYSKYISIKAFIRVVEQIAGSGGYSLFDLVQKDHLLSFEESEGFALQGTYVYKDSVAGERYGYPDFIQECINEKNAEGTITQRIDLGGGQSIMGYVNPNGHIYYDISEKSKVDTYFNQYGVAWFWGVDEENETVFLPRNNYFFKNSSINPGGYNPATLPSLAHTHSLSIDSNGSHSHSVDITAAGTHTHTITIGEGGVHNHTETTAGRHTHSVTIVENGSHTHTITVTIPNHDHTFTGTKVISGFPGAEGTYRGNKAGNKMASSITASVNKDGKKWYKASDFTKSCFSTYEGNVVAGNAPQTQFDMNYMKWTYTPEGSISSKSLTPSVNCAYGGAHQHDADATYEGDHTHTINNGGNHTHTATNEDNGSHIHDISIVSNGSHTHDGTAASREIVPAGMIGTTVTPPSINMLLYIVVGNVRRRAAMVIDQQLEEALEEIDEHVEEKKTEIDDYVTQESQALEQYVEDAKDEIDAKVEEVKEDIEEYTEQAQEYSEISRQQAEISEYWANISIKGQVQADWDEDDPTEKSYIKNKPNIDWSSLVYANNIQTLTNKTISASNNTISNLGLNNFSTGVVVSLITSESTNNTIATSHAIWEAIQDVVINFSNIDSSAILTTLTSSTVSNTTLATSQAIWNAIQSVVIGFSNIDSNDILTTLTSSTVSNTTLATSQAIWNAIQALPTSGMTVVSIVNNTSTNNTIATSQAIWNAIQSVNNQTLQVIANTEQSILSIPIVGMDVVNSLDNPGIVSSDSVPTSLAVYQAILNASSTSGITIEGEGIINVDSNLSTAVDISSSNPNLEITSSYTGTQSDIGVITYDFVYENNGWKLGDEVVQLIDYDLLITDGTPQEGDTINLTYTTTSTTIISADVTDLNTQLDYDLLKDTPNYVFAEGLKISPQLYTIYTVYSSNLGLTISSTYSPLINGDITLNFNYIVDEDEPSNTGWYNNGGLVDLATFDITVTGIPEDGDHFTIVYNTTKYNYVSTDIEYTNGVTKTNILKTTTDLYCSNQNLLVTSSYSGTQVSEGIISYSFEYQEIEEDVYGWVDTDTQTEVDLTNYDLTVVGTPEVSDQITLVYITTKGKVTVSADSSVVKVNTTQTLTNKTIDADDNTITDLTTSNFKSGTISTEVRATSSASNTVIPTEKAVRDAIDNSVVSAVVYKGVFEAAGKTNYSSITLPVRAGYLYYVSTGVDVTIDGIQWNAGDYLLINEDVATGGTITSAKVKKIDNTEGSDVVRLAVAQTLTNKTIDADDNTITDLTTSNFKSGVVQTSIRNTSTASNTAIPTEKAVRDTIDSLGIDNLVTINTTQTVTGTKTINDLSSTTQSISTSSTAVATTKYARNLQAYQPIVTFNGGNVVLQDDVSVYAASNNITSATTFTFNTSNLNYLSSSVFYTFELKFSMTTVAALTFPSNVVWQNNEAPDMSNTGTYLLVFRTLDGGSNWVGNLQGKW